MLPPELVRDIGGYSAFFDEKSLSLVTKQLYAFLGDLRFPDQFSWAIYLCIVAKDHQSSIQSPTSPSTIANAMRELDQRFYAHYDRSKEPFWPDWHVKPEYTEIFLTWV